MPSFLVDTNVWLRSVDALSAQHQPACRAIAGILAQGDNIFLAPQNLIEFWAVVTRPVGANGLGWTIERVGQEVASLRAQFPLLSESDEIFRQWLELVTKHRLAGKRVHDARLAAIMAVHSITRLLTFDHEHFMAFSHITIVRPDMFAANPALEKL